MLEIANFTPKPTPRIAWKKIKEDILGKNHEVSLVIARDDFMRKINKNYRKKDQPANTLSFRLDKAAGEIFLNIKNSKKTLTHLFIHSLLHLKGYRHGEKMDKAEQKYLKKHYEP